MAPSPALAVPPIRLAGKHLDRMFPRSPTSTANQRRPERSVVANAARVRLLVFSALLTISGRAGQRNDQGAARPADFLPQPGTPQAGST
jgi:hypothetical protein